MEKISLLIICTSMLWIIQIGTAISESLRGSGELIVTDRGIKHWNAYLKKDYPSVFIVDNKNRRLYYYYCSSITCSPDRESAYISRVKTEKGPGNWKIFAVGKKIVWNGPVCYKGKLIAGSGLCAGSKNKGGPDYKPSGKKFVSRYPYAQNSKPDSKPGGEKYFWDYSPAQNSKPDRKEHLERNFNSVKESEKKFIQNRLYDLGLYTGKIDGVYGKKTRSAIISYAKSIKFTHEITRAGAQKLLAKILELPGTGRAPVADVPEPPTSAPVLPEPEPTIGDLRDPVYAQQLLEDVKGFAIKNPGVLDSVVLASRYQLATGELKSGKFGSAASNFNKLAEHALASSAFTSFHSGVMQLRVESDEAERRRLAATLKKTVADVESRIAANPFSHDALPLANILKRYQDIPEDAGLPRLREIVASLRTELASVDNASSKTKPSKTSPPNIETAKPIPAPAKTVVPPAAPVEARAALVIGNTRYRHAGALTNPGNDAKLFATTLRGMGFQSVTVKLDQTREQMIQSLQDFASISDNADWAVIYYAGHGIEFGGINYLIPTEARLESDRDVELETVEVSKVLRAIEGAKKFRLIVLDACRNNPFVSQMRRTMASRSLGRGLARIEPQAGTLIAYSAKHGEFALDGKGENSPYVKALVD